MRGACERYVQWLPLGITRHARRGEDVSRCPSPLPFPPAPASARGLGNEDATRVAVETVDGEAAIAAVPRRVGIDPQLTPRTFVE